MTLNFPNYLLNNGIEMPAFGLGVYRMPPQETIDTVKGALASGYRMIDTAAVYGNEREVGAAIAESDVDRSEIFVTTKLWISDFGRDSTFKAFDTSLQKLGLHYVDLYLLHWPLHDEFSLTVESYQAMEEILTQGRIRAIGVSNFQTDHLRQLAQEAATVPAVNQIELHPYFSQPEMRAYHHTQKIMTQAWSPLGGVNIYDATDPGKERHVLTDPVLLGIAAGRQKTPAQVILRWHLQHGISIIPKSTRMERILQNAAIFDFSLSEKEMIAIDALDTGSRGGPHPDEGSRERFPYEVPV